MALYRVKVRWDGMAGAPGYSILHFDAAVAPNVDGAQNAADATATFFASCRQYVPTTVTTRVEPVVEIIDETTGALTDIFTVTTPAAGAGGVTGTYSAAAGACISWTTVGIRNGRRVRGRTFIVPLGASTAYEANGTLSSGALTAFNSAAQALIDHTSDFGIYSRPSAPGAADGEFFTVAGHRVQDKTAVLRSRRD